MSWGRLFWNEHNLPEVEAARKWLRDAIADHELPAEYKWRTLVEEARAAIVGCPIRVNSHEQAEEQRAWVLANMDLTKHWIARLKPLGDINSRVSKVEDLFGAMALMQMHPHLTTARVAGQTLEEHLRDLGFEAQWDACARQGARINFTRTQMEVTHEQGPPVAT